MKYKYYYIEDEFDIGESFIEVFQQNNLVKVELKSPQEFDNQIKYLREKINSFDGLIIDLRLDDNKSKNNKVNYRATSLAQDIRTKQTENYFGKDFPIIICSTDQKIRKSISYDLANQNIFDLAIIKDEISKSKGEISLKLYSIAKAYKTILLAKNDFAKNLGLKNLENLDKRIFVRFNKTNKYPIHEFARYILNEIVLKAGVLIDERLLGARLGIDIEQSPDWELLKQKFNKEKYKGIYSDAWERWWMFGVNDWWKRKMPGMILGDITATERVRELKRVTKLNKLFPSKPIPKCESERFWTICQAYQKPLDPLEGFRMNEEEPESWQDVSYISLEAILEREHIKKKIEIHPIENNRLKETKKYLL